VTAAAPPSAARLVRGAGTRRTLVPPHLAPFRTAPRRHTSLPFVRISRAHWDELVAHAREESPNECCGYMRLQDGAVEEVFRAVNERASPYGYELDHRSLFAANERAWRIADGAVEEEPGDVD
jgi:Prokaryotic homologs of the JAB domain